MTTTQTGTIMVIVGHLIRYATGNANLLLYVDGILVDQGTAYTKSTLHRAAVLLLSMHPLAGACKDSTMAERLMINYWPQHLIY